MNFRSYGISKGIYESFDKEKFKGKIAYTDENLFEHINILYDLHERLKGCQIPKNNLINKMIDDFKVAELFLRQDLKNYENYKNDFEQNVFKVGGNILYRIQNILRIISKSNYDNMILRGIKNREICVYNVALNEVYMSSNLKIYVKNIDEFCENIVEYDYIKFFTKLKRANKKIDFKKCCGYVCFKEGIDIDSYNFILACVSFPYEFIRILCRYRDLGRELSNYSNECDFTSVLKKDGESLV